MTAFALVVLGIKLNLIGFNTPLNAKNMSKPEVSRLAQSPLDYVDVPSENSHCSSLYMTSTTRLADDISYKTALTVNDLRAGADSRIIEAAWLLITV